MCIKLFYVGSEVKIFIKEVKKLGRSEYARGKCIVFSWLVEIFDDESFSGVILWVVVSLGKIKRWSR